MNRLIILFLTFFICCQWSSAQDKLFLTFEFMKVDEGQGQAYADTENFWSKIHQVSANKGDILGWDQWSLLPGGEEQGFQYLVVTLYDDPVKMMDGFSWKQLLSSAMEAYPDMSKEDILEKIGGASESRDLVVRNFMEQIATTDSENHTYEMKEGMIASMDFMKAEPGQSYAYETAEKEIFMPMHQREIDAGHKGSWSLLRCMLPIGSKAYASHMTVNMYDSYSQYFGDMEFAEGQYDATSESAVQKGLDTRDMKWVYMARLEKMVRKQATKVEK